MTQNVVTYTVEVITDNSSGKLFPYLTANVEFALSNRSDVLLVPNAAMRWYPRAEKISPKCRVTASGSGRRGGTDNGVGKSSEPHAQAAAMNSEDRVWIQEGSYVRPIMVRAGLRNGTLTEVEGDGLKEGLKVIVGEQRRAANSNGIAPFAPQFMRNNRP